jgi:glutaredoxin
VRLKKGEVIMQITVYSSESCIFCRQLKEWFLSEGIEFENRDISKEKKFHDEFVAHGGTGIPLTIFEKSNGDINKITGMNKNKILEALK